MSVCVCVCFFFFFILFYFFLIIIYKHLNVAWVWTWNLKFYGFVSENFVKDLKAGFSSFFDKFERGGRGGGDVGVF